ncbi:hypothetical protein FisN_2Hh437 [Fistulifera solaris]|uniref:Anaphase-promoting complex subunit 4 WD40 domain-containing protein n=1 Tax=Fistulifera solaris TaxID=1519565 RepID=A0A1Z5KKS4_FISSO|nr:hypothetical protein FisN_2Hh437 [Fistulifera solaris]|eukprot:GAX26631.1 hypothetical protein FisN_2Hh437 [Fistulifera solaris]
MAPKGPDASNSCLPPTSPVIISTPPIPHTERGERCSLDGTSGRLHGTDKPMLSYCSGKLIVTRTLDDSALLPSISPLPVLCYRGHHYTATALKLSPSGAYMASGDERGMLRIWAFDHEDHLCKYENPGLTSVIRDLAWDGESKKVAMGGERLDARSDCARVLQYDTGVTVGALAMHFKGRVASVAYKPNRPFRIVTAGKDDTKTYFHQGPPFAKIPPVDGIPQDSGHSKGAVTCVRYNQAGTLVVSVSSDRAICTYDGKTLELKHKLEQVHSATIYCVDWSGDDKYVMTASGDGTCKLFAVDDNGTLSEQHTWKPAEHQNGGAYEKVPVGGNQVACAFSGGKRPVSVSLNGQISLLPPLGSSDPIQVITGHSAAVGAMALDVASGVFYTGDSDGVLCQWDLKTCTAKGRLLPSEGNADLMYVVHTGAVSGLAVMNGALLSVGWDDKLFVTPSGSLQVNMEPEIIGAQPSAIAVGTNKGAVATVAGLALCGPGGALQTIMATNYEATAICVSKDDKTLYVGGNDCKIHIYDISGDQPVENHVIENGHLKPLTALALSNDGTKLAAGDQRDVCVWDLSNYTALVAKGRWCFHVQRVTCLSWSPDDQVIASGGADDSIYLWSMEKKMKRIHYPFAHRGGLTGLSFVNDGYKFVSVGADSVVNMWDVAKDVKEKFA